MSFYRRIKYFLVHTLKLTNEDAQAIIDKGVIELDGLAIKDNVFLNDFTEIKIDGKDLRLKNEDKLLNKNIQIEDNKMYISHGQDNISEYAKEYQTVLEKKLDVFEN